MLFNSVYHLPLNDFEKNRNKPRNAKSLPQHPKATKNVCLPTRISWLMFLWFHLNKTDFVVVHMLYKFISSYGQVTNGFGQPIVACLKNNHSSNMQALKPMFVSGLLDWKWNTQTRKKSYQSILFLISMTSSSCNKSFKIWGLKQPVICKLIIYNLLKQLTARLWTICLQNKLATSLLTANITAVVGKKLQAMLMQCILISVITSFCQTSTDLWTCYLPSAFTIPYFVLYMATFANWAWACLLTSLPGLQLSTLAKGMFPLQSCGSET